MPRDLPPWRQFGCFTLAAAPHLREHLADGHGDDEAVYVVLTHSCSLVSEDFQAEPKAEYMVGRQIAEPNPMCLGRRNPRELHIQLDGPDGAKPWYCFRIHERGFFDRMELLKATPTSEIGLPAETCETMLRWIVDRYQAATFPDAFNKRIGAIKKQITKALSHKEAEPITGLWVVVSPA